MTTLDISIKVKLPDEVMDLLERLVTVLELEYDERYGREEDNEDDDDG